VLVGGCAVSSVRQSVCCTAAAAVIRMCKKHTHECFNTIFCARERPSHSTPRCQSQHSLTALVGGLALLAVGLIHATAAIADGTEEGEREEETSVVAPEVTAKVFIGLKVFGCSRFHREKEYVQW